MCDIFGCGPTVVSKKRVVTDRQTDRETDRQTDRQTESQRDTAALYSRCTHFVYIDVITYQSCISNFLTVTKVQN